MITQILLDFFCKRTLDNIANFLSWIFKNCQESCTAVLEILHDINIIQSSTQFKKDI